MKICFLVPDGVGLRNYLYSKLMDEFPDEVEIMLLTVLPQEVVKDVALSHRHKISHVAMTGYKESFKGKLLKEVITYARLRYNTRKVQNDTIMINWTRKNFAFWTRLFFAMAAFIGFFFSFSYKSIEWLEKQYSRHLRSTGYFEEQTRMLNEHQPDVIFSTHQRSLDGSVIVEAAKALGIKTIGAIYSWDNLPKARLLVRTEHYVVWSDYMKQEMADYYPEIHSENIVVTGTPQFEFYFNKDLYMDRAAFFAQEGLDPNRKVLCFSGNDLTFPCDEKYLNDLAEALMQMPEKDRPQVLLRRAPVDLSGRFKPVIEQFPELIKASDPLWKTYSKGWSFIVPTREDIKLLVNVALHADAVINVGSTMAHDFAVYGKPAIYINYDQPSVTHWSAVTNNQYQHFRSMPNKDCVIWLNGKDEIAACVNKAMNGPLPDAETRAAWFRVVALQPLAEASKRIAGTIMSL
ncbi:hypothetical protein [Geofilum rubicundum]|uniref:hypothetical protein n=1 Tax=Geofilum rubicundum TaxID=472113 RepID=UPI0007811719|nr:hypothetical protein [Geofilum rubicundum]